MSVRTLATALSLAIPLAPAPTRGAEGPHAVGVREMSFTHSPRDPELRESRRPGPAGEGAAAHVSGHPLSVCLILHEKADRFAYADACTMLSSDPGECPALQDEIATISTAFWKLHLRKDGEQFAVLGQLVASRPGMEMSDPRR